jgi:hypothetical protein
MDFFRDVLHQDVSHLRTIAYDDPRARCIHAVSRLGGLYVLQHLTCPRGGIELLSRRQLGAEAEDDH